VEQPSGTQNVKPPDLKRKGQQPTIVNPPDNKNADKQLKPGVSRSSNNKKQSPQTTTSTKNKGKVPDAQPQKTNKHKPDGTKDK
jgi:hypothetical protein